MPTKVELPISLRIEPTQADIVAGTCHSPTKCMYAMALRRMFPRATYVSVNSNCVTITLNGIYHHYTIPKRAVKNIILYDDKKPINIAKSKITISLADKRPAAYISTAEVRESHRLRSACYRARPGYVRPDSRTTLRAQLARASLVRKSEPDLFDDE